jgi:hypothetical protein
MSIPYAKNAGTRRRFQETIYRKEHPEQVAARQERLATHPEPPCGSRHRTTRPRNAEPGLDQRPSQGELFRIDFRDVDPGVDRRPTQEEIYRTDFPEQFAVGQVRLAREREEALKEIVLILAAMILKSTLILRK